ASHQPPSDPNPSEKAPSTPPSKNEAVSNALAQIPSSQNTLITPVYIPEDPHAILKETHSVMRLLDNSAIVVQRQLEMMNVLMGFEQANRYIIMDPHGNHIGYLAEQDHGIGSALKRQMFRTHRSFTTHVFDREEKEVLRFHRPFSFINSQIRVYDAAPENQGGHYTHSAVIQGASAQSVLTQTSASVSSIPLNEMRIIGSAEQEWGLLRRKYNLFLARDLDETPAAPGTPQIASGDLPLSNSKALQVVEGDQRQPGMMQFARVDEPFLSWDFSLMSEDGRRIGSVNRNFSGFARELFTDTGVYALRMDAAALSTEGQQATAQNDNQLQTASENHPGMTLDQRAVMLATAVSIDFDYFSRHSGAGGGMGFFPLWFPGMGGGGVAAGEAGAAGAAGAAGEAGIASEAGAAARGLGAAEGVTGAAAGAGTMAAYDAMQRSRGDSQSPQATDPYEQPLDQQQPDQGEEIWGESQSSGTRAPDDPFGWWGGGEGQSQEGESEGGFW
ncbi:Scramblase-domain-containing protein, partial [Westerdykella ornata]